MPAKTEKSELTYAAIVDAALDLAAAQGLESLSLGQVAKHLGLSVRTVEAYRRDGRLPEATMVGRTPTWTRAQIDAWQANRPGQGARTDLRPKH